MFVASFLIINTLKAFYDINQIIRGVFHSRSSTSSSSSIVINPHLRRRLYLICKIFSYLCLIYILEYKSHNLFFTIYWLEYGSLMPSNWAIQFVYWVFHGVLKPEVIEEHLQNASVTLAWVVIAEATSFLKLRCNLILLTILGL